MPVVRVYVPVGRDDLEHLVASGVLAAGPGTPREGYAVTSGLEESAVGHDLDDLEYAAFSDAVAASGRRRSTPSDRRVVVSADAAPEWVVPREGEPVTRVVLMADLPLARIASFHIDEDAGASGAAGEAVGEGEADDLLWYDVTEFDDVRELLG